MMMVQPLPVGQMMRTLVVVMVRAARTVRERTVAGAPGRCGAYLARHLRLHMAHVALGRIGR